MHDPYEWYPVLKTNTGTQIDAIAAYDNYFLCGTKQGDLIMYSVVCKNSNQTGGIQLVRYHKNFYRKPIQQLAVIPLFNILVILADNTVCTHDMSAMNFPLISTLQKTKGASLFTIDVENQADKSLTHSEKYIVRLCVAVKKKIQLFYWKNNSFLELGDDITVSDIPKSIALCKQSVCIGFKSEYAIIQLAGAPENRNQKDLFPTGKNLEPYVIQHTDCTFALIRDNQSIFVDTDGNLLVKNAVKWSEVPVALAYDEPYLLALLNETIEVRSVQPSLLVQHIQVPGAQLICRSSSGVLYVLAGRQVFRVQTIPVNTQIKTLIKEKQFQLALKLCNISDDEEKEKMRKKLEIQTFYAYDLFNNKQFSESMKQFLELDTDPYDVIRLFPNLLPQYASEESAGSENQTMLQNRDLDKSLQALIDYLTEARLKLLTSDKKKNTGEQRETLSVIDTTLLKCYVNTNDALIAPLLRLNNCKLDDSEKVLKKHKKYSELIILYETKELHHKALELLEKQAEQQDSPLRGVEKTVQYLQRLGKGHIDLILRFSGWVLEKYPEEGLKIFTEDLTEVEHLPRQKVLDYLQRTNKSLVIPYLEHVIYTWHDTTAIMHNALAHQYRERVLELCNPSCSSSEQVVGQNMRIKLINFLEKSQYYTPEKILTLFPFNSLHEERAILLGKLKQHNQALAIYVMVLGDIEKAVHYCDQVYKREGPDDAQQVYVSLLQLLINPLDNWLVGVTPSAPQTPDIEMALNLLESNAARISPELALPLLPKDIPFQRIKHYLSVSLSEHLNKKRKNQILRGLLYAEHLQVQERRILFESENMLLTEWNICPVCKKRFSNQSAFIRNPNGDVIHFSCQEQEQNKSAGTY